MQNKGKITKLKEILKIPALKYHSNPPHKFRFFVVKVSLFALINELFAKQSIHGVGYSRLKIESKYLQSRLNVKRSNCNIKTISEIEICKTLVQTRSKK